jgi:hypothetical protein
MRPLQYQKPAPLSLEVGNSQDFTVIVPSFKIGESVVPELSTQLRWSDEKYRIWFRCNKWRNAHGCHRAVALKKWQ